MRNLLPVFLIILACGGSSSSSQVEDPNALHDDHNWAEEEVLRFLILCRQNAEEDGYEDPYDHCNCFFNSISQRYPEGIDFEEITAGDLRDSRADCFDY